jgi:RNA polymerase sigma factor (sigma-70 family)
MGAVMKNEISPQNLLLETLVQRCKEETGHYFRNRGNDPKYCFELFARAIIKRNEEAWTAIIENYRYSVTRWVNHCINKHFDFSFTNEDQQDFIAEAFERFWKYFTPEKFNKSHSLADVLRYLQTCVNGAILDAWRKTRRHSFDQELDAEDESQDTDQPKEEPTPEELIQIEEFWKLIQTKVKDRKEYVVIYASYNLALSSREILVEYPELFHEIKEIYQYKANAKARIEDDPEIRDFFHHR